MLGLLVGTFWFSLLAAVLYYHRDGEFMVDIHKALTEFAQGFWSPWHLVIFKKYPESRPHNHQKRSDEFSRGETAGEISVILALAFLVILSIISIIWACL